MTARKLVGHVTIAAGVSPWKPIQLGLVLSGAIKLYLERELLHKPGVSLG